MQKWSMIAAALLLGVNVAGFAMCAADKRAARLKKRRVPEKTLLAYALFLGAAGVYCAMLIFSHKTKKLRFSVLVPIAVAAQAVLMGWIFWRLG
jgi:uncharacterized membrane protein YsdA (DUF1294 family)